MCTTESRGLCAADAKRVERDNSNRRLYIFDCAGGCGHELRIQPGALKKRTGLCGSCARKGQTYNANIAELKRLAKRIERPAKYNNIVYILDCTAGCGREIRVYNNSGARKSLKCRSCARLGRHVTERSKMLADVAKRQEKVGGTWVYILDCALGCGREVRVRSTATSSRRCRSCIQGGKPFGKPHRSMEWVDSAKGRDTMTYEEYLAFTAQSHCTYCRRLIPWDPFEKEFHLYLDRLNNDLGHTTDNCVVCCTDCNMLRGHRLTYDEMVRLGPALREVWDARQTAA